jgi:hypothetical protein
MLSNDIVVTCEFSDSKNVSRASNYVNVFVSNKKTKHEFRQDMLEYSYISDSMP